MDKYEYQVCADQIKTLISERRYAEAMNIADTIDWRKVRSVSMLCTVSEVYKINKKYEEARDILFLAYDRYPGGRTIVYALCELAIKLNDVLQAKELYEEYVRLAPEDTGKYILLYKLYEALDVSLEERIEVLEEFKKRDYRERWAYELAYLYHKTGQETRCVQECDELILWFGDGRYVKQAMDLKMQHTRLSKEQQLKYEGRQEPINDKFMNMGQTPVQQIYDTDPQAGNPQQIPMQPPVQQPSMQQPYDARYNGSYMGQPMQDPQQMYMQGTSGEAGPLGQGQDMRITAEPVTSSGQRTAQMLNTSEIDSIQVQPVNVGMYNTMDLQNGLSENIKKFFERENARAIDEGVTLSADPESYDRLYENNTMDIPGSTDEIGMSEENGPVITVSEITPSENELDDVPGNEEDVQITTFMPDKEEIYKSGSYSYNTEPESSAGLYMAAQELSPSEEDEAVMQAVMGHDGHEMPSDEGVTPVTGEVAAPAGTMSAGSVPAEEEPAEEEPVEEETAAAGTGAADPDEEDDEIYRDDLDSIYREWEDKKRESEERRIQEAKEKSLVWTSDIMAQLKGVLPEIDDIARPTPPRVVTGEETGEVPEIEPVFKPYRTASAGSEVKPASISIPLPVDDIEQAAEAGPDFARQPEEKPAEEPAEEPVYEEAEQELTEDTEESYEEAEQEASEDEELPEEEPAEESVEEEQPEEEPVEEELPQEEEPAEDEELPEEEPAEESVEEEQPAEEPIEEEQPEEEPVEEEEIPEEEPAEEEQSEEEPAEEEQPEEEPAEEEEQPEEEPVEEEEQPKEEPAEEKQPEEEPKPVKPRAFTPWREVPDEEPEQESADEKTAEDEADRGSEVKDAEEAATEEAATEEAEVDYGNMEISYDPHADMGFDPEKIDVSVAVTKGEFDYLNNTDPGSGNDIYFREIMNIEDSEEEVFGDEKAGLKKDASEEELTYSEDEEAARKAAFEVTSELPEYPYETLEDYGEVEEIEVIEQPEGLDGIMKTNDLPLDDIARANYEAGIEPEDDENDEPKETSKKKHPSYMKLEKAPVSKRDFDKEEQLVFGRFEGIEWLKAQIVNSIDNIDMDPSRGNVLVMGTEATGRRSIAIDVVKVMQSLEDGFKGKVAKISGEALNKKDIPLTIKKLRHGALIIENSEGLTPSSARIVAEALELETEPVLVVMEGETTGVTKLINASKDIFDRVFNSRIELQDFTTDDLVAYGKGYAREKEYAIDEMGVLALYRRIGDMQTLDHIVTLEEVREIVDNAIKHVDKKNMSHFVDVLLAKRYDDEDYIILREKDFIV
ncbi:MAG: hypothetical protein K6E63_12570 [Lachnospiraceae bacterium]|nr:hypothetical protein [Lachnospiraceae bacterium]